MGRVVKALQFMASGVSAAAAVVLALTASQPVQAQTAKVEQVAAKRTAKSNNAPRVYLIRGFLNVFSMGMDEVAADIRRHGIYADAYASGSGGYIVDQLIADYKRGKRGPIILVGHSLGAPEVVYMSDRLGDAGITTDMVISLDPITSVTANGRVKQLLNFYVSDGPGQRVLKGPRFRGTLRNIDLKGRDDVGHVAIAQSQRFHKELERYILAAARRGSAPRPAVAAKPAAATTDKPAEATKVSGTKADSSPKADSAKTDSAKTDSAKTDTTSSIAKPVSASAGVKPSAASSAAKTGGEGGATAR